MYEKTIDEYGNVHRRADAEQAEAIIAREYLRRNRKLR